MAPGERSQKSRDRQKSVRDNLPQTRPFSSFFVSAADGDNRDTGKEKDASGGVALL